MNILEKIKSRLVACCAAGALALVATCDAASAQTIGGQVQTMSTEFSTTAGFVGSTAMYAAALAVFVMSVWHLWKSRQPDNRDSGGVAAGLAGLVLVGLLASGGVWIGKASQTTTGGAAVATSTAGVVAF